MSHSICQVIVPIHEITASGGTIVKWHATDRAFVSHKQLLVTIETQKANLEVVAELAGRLQIKLKEGESIRAGEMVGHIDTSTQVPPQPVAIIDGKSARKGRGTSLAKQARDKSVSELRFPNQPLSIPPPPEKNDPAARLDFDHSKPVDFADAVGLPPLPEGAFAPAFSPTKKIGKDKSRMERSKPIFDYAAQIGLPDLTETEWMDFIEADKPLVTTAVTDNLKQQRRRKK